jgi:hypothetical protein
LKIKSPNIIMNPNTLMSNDAMRLSVRPHLRLLKKMLPSKIVLAVFASVVVMVGVVSLEQASVAQYPGFGDPGSRQASTGGAGGLVPVEEQIDGGAIPTGASAQVVVRFRNEGSQPVQTGTIRLYPSSTVSAEITMNQCAEEALPLGAECAIALTVSGLQLGPWRLEMLMSHSGRSRLVTTTLSGSVETVGEQDDRRTSDVEASPEIINFGSVNVSQALVEPIVLRNITSDDIEIEDIYIDSKDAAGYTLSSDCETLKVGQACIATISWSPKSAGASSGVLVIKHDGPAGLSTVGIKGDYTPEAIEQADIFPDAVPGKGLLVSSQTQVDFGSGIETASTITVSLVNAGDAPLEISNVKISGSDSGLNFKEGGCGTGIVLEPIEACPLTLTWSPTRVGNLVDDIQITHDGARGILVLPVRGESDSSVSQDQKAIVLGNSSSAISVVNSSRSEATPTQTDGGQPSLATRSAPSRPSSFDDYAPVVQNPAGVLDGFKITSFAATRAIVNGPGGSRIVFDGEEIVLGGVPWLVDIQKNGIQFETRQGQRVLLLFDRSLSSLNSIQASTSSDDAGSEESSESSSSN